MHFEGIDGRARIKERNGSEMRLSIRRARQRIGISGQCGMVYPTGFSQRWNSRPE